jgi:hypothetical protein
MAAVAMSDMRGGNQLGELGVKAAFGESACCFLGCSKMKKHLRQRA